MLKDPANFRLVIRAIGILILAMGVPQLIQMAYWAVQFALATPEARGGQTLSPTNMIYYFVSPLASVMIGYYLLFGASGLIRHCIRESRETCAMCGHDNTGKAMERCPKCGEAIAASCSVQSPTKQSQLDERHTS